MAGAAACEPSRGLGASRTEHDVSDAISISVLVQAGVLSREFARSLVGRASDELVVTNHDGAFWWRHDTKHTSLGSAGGGLRIGTHYQRRQHDLECGLAHVGGGLARHFEWAA